MDRLNAKDVAMRLEGWEQISGREAIERSFGFSDFKEAWAFMSAVALKAEQMDHHPEWSNVYNRVDVVLTTHDANGVTNKDLELGVYMDQLARQLIG